MATINWKKYRAWRESKGLNNADVAIFEGKQPTEVSEFSMDWDGTRVFVVQFGKSPMFIVPETMMSEE